MKKRNIRHCPSILCPPQGMGPCVHLLVLFKRLVFKRGTRHRSGEKCESKKTRQRGRQETTH